VCCALNQHNIFKCECDAKGCDFRSVCLESLRRGRVHDECPAGSHRCLEDGTWSLSSTLHATIGRLWFIYLFNNTKALTQRARLPPWRIRSGFRTPDSNHFQNLVVIFLSKDTSMIKKFTKIVQFFLKYEPKCVKMLHVAALKNPYKNF